MTEKEKKIDAFAETRLSDWEVAAREELKGADPWKKLSVTSNNLLLKPIYGPETSPSDSFVLKRAATDVRGARSWFNCPRVVVSDPVTANAMALQHLEAGADGIFFELRSDAIDFNRLLLSIEWSFCALHFTTNSKDPKTVQGLQSILSEGKGEAAGVWFGPAPEGTKHPTFRFGGTTVDSTNPSAIALLADWVIAASKVNPSRANVSIDLGRDFFQDIAALRALRMVWDIIHEGKPPVPIYIHVNSRPWKNAGFEPHGNMLKATSAAMAAVLGGADALTIDPEDPSDPMQRRVARNVAILLREESRLSKVADPLAGCYFLDDLTKQFSAVILNAIKANKS